MGIAKLLAALEARSRDRPDRVLRLRGELPRCAGVEGQSGEAFEVLIFRGFSSSVTHPTAVDPDRPLLPEGSCILAGELLEGPLRLDRPILAGPWPVERFLDPAAWS